MLDVLKVLGCGYVVYCVLVIGGCLAGFLLEMFGKLFPEQRPEFHSLPREPDPYSYAYDEGSGFSRMCCLPESWGLVPMISRAGETGSESSASRAFALACPSQRHPLETRTEEELRRDELANDGGWGQCGGFC